MVLVSGYATPDRLRRVGRARLAAWLRARHVRSYAQLADRAVTAAGTQHVALPGQEITAAIVSELASSVLALDARITDVDAQIAATFELHPQAAIIVSMPGFGPFLGRRWWPPTATCATSRPPSRRCTASPTTHPNRANDTPPPGRLVTHAP